MSIFQYNLNKDIIFSKINTSFQNPISEEDEKKLIEVFSNYKNTTFFNGDAIRLEKITQNTNNINITLSKISFFNFLTTNIIPLQLEDFSAYLTHQKIEKKIFDILSLLEENYNTVKKSSDFSELLCSKTSSNALAVSLLLTDNKDNLLLTKRPLNVGIGESLYSTSVTGALDDSDFDSSNPFLHCAIREAKEELNLSIEYEQLKLDSIVVGKHKLQPIIIINGKCNYNFTQYFHQFSSAKDYKLEVDKFFFISKKNINPFLSDKKMTEAAKYHLFSYLHPLKRGIIL